MTARCARSPLLVAALLVGACTTMRAPDPSVRVPPPVRQVLTNGVVLIAQEQRASDVVALQLWMRVGGRDESPDELGLSHYLEHMLFKGTPTRPPGSIDRLIEGFGGASNAFTSYDYTHFDLVVPARQLRTGADVLADIAVNAAFDPKELESEKKVVFEEMGLTEDDPERFLVRRLSEVAYAPHPYGRPILGTRELVQSLTRARLNAYYKKHYVPKAMVFVVVGAVTTQQAREVAEATFGRLTGAEPVRAPAASLPRLDATRRVDVPRAEQQAYLGLAWLAAPTRDADIQAVDLLTYILGDGPSSRLNQQVREQLGLVSTIDATYVARQQSGFVSVTARLDADKLDAAERAILDVVRQVRSAGISESERQRAIVTAEASYAFDIETAEGLARTYGEAETISTLEEELSYLARLRQVSAAQIQAAARKYFGDDNYARVRFMPAGTR